MLFDRIFGVIRMVCSSRRTGAIFHVKRKKAFSLIELLVVISILSVLCSLLAPGLRSARDKVKALSCMNNMRQIGLAMMLYAQSNNDMLPAPLQDSSSKGFEKFIWTYAGYRGEPSYMTGGVAAAGIFHCPGDTIVRDLVDSPPRSYAMNVGLSPYNASDPPNTRGPVSNDGSSSLAEISAPSTTVLVQEWRSSVNRFANRCDSVKHGYGGSLRTFAIYHGGGANYLFCDGHVSWVAPADYKQGWATIDSGD
ncbi:MAG: DUF1559 domain-containing protein [Verrucomicrobiae bacterium]|nr:DUF1559 domain-containing protein [Verrucomicrobiae bacterium]